MSVQSYFSEDYFRARTAFRAACQTQGLTWQSHANPHRGPDGSPLSTEVLYLGEPGARRLLILVSGVHGVEALAGAACQTGLLLCGRFRALPADTAVLMVHVINPWGSVHSRRNTEENVDLCRNFVDFSAPLPARPGYDAIHEAVNCAQRVGPERDAARARVAEIIREHGMDAYIQSLMGGQYQHPDGFSYGGGAPTWARQTLLAVLAEHAHSAQEVCVVEYHTGLGPWAYGTAVTMHTGPDCARARAWFGPWIVAPNERENGAIPVAYRVYGHTTDGYRQALPNAELTSIVLEFGTYPPQESLPAMLDDHWLSQFGDESSELGQAIRERMLRLHYPSDPDWRQSVWDRSELVVTQALRGLAATA